MNRFSLFRGLRHQTLKRPAAVKDKPTKGAGVGFALFVIIYGLAVVVPIRAQDDSAILYPGVHQAEDWRVTLPVDSSLTEGENAEFSKFVHAGSPVTFDVYGTELVIRWRGEQSLRIAVDENDVWAFIHNGLYRRVGDFGRRSLTDGISEGKNIRYRQVTTVDTINNWRESRINLSPNAQKHHIEVSGIGVGSENELALTATLAALGADYLRTPFDLDSITVLDRTFENLFPYIAAVGITLGMTLFVVVSALRERRSNR